MQWTSWRCGSGTDRVWRGGDSAQVPRSAKIVVQDQDYILFSVILFKRVADSFKNTARAKGFQVGFPDLPAEGTSRQRLLQWVVDAMVATNC